MDIEKTLAERGSRYGKFKDHAKIAQGIQNVMRETEGWDQLADDQKQALTVIADKIARMLNGDPDYLDNWHDIIGYAKLVHDRLDAPPNKWMASEPAFVRSAKAAAKQAAQEPALPSKAWDAAGWIEWKGGENPAGDSKVQYRLRDGYSHTCLADFLSWKHVGGPSDIVAYKVIEEAPKSHKPQMIKGPDGLAYIANQRGLPQPEETRGKRVKYFVQYEDGRHLIEEGESDLIMWGLVREESYIGGYIILDDKPEEKATPELPEGFTAWNGGPRPTGAYREVRVQFRNGDISGAVQAEAFRWSHLGRVSDIVAYRVL